MSKYEITPLNSNKTILQVVKGIEKYLHDNQIYKVFGYNGNYDAETELYDISDLYTSEELKADDVVLFDNCYLGIVDAVGTNNFSVKDVINFRGEKGDTGATGQTGEDGEDGVGITTISSTQVGNQINLTFTLTDGTTQTITFSVGSGGNATTLLWSGLASSINISQLADDITNYNFLLITLALDEVPLTLLFNLNNPTKKAGFAQYNEYGTNFYLEMGSIIIDSDNNITFGSAKFTQRQTYSWTEMASKNISYIYGLK